MKWRKKHYRKANNMKNVKDLEIEDKYQQKTLKEGQCGWVCRKHRM